MSGTKLVVRVILGLGLLSARSIASEPIFRVAVYVPDYRMASFDPLATRGVTDLILFSASLKPDGQIDLSRLSKTPWAKLKQLKEERKTRLILAIGGWERSQHFAEIASSKERRRAFVKSALNLCEKYQLDGFDLDWEHPKDSKEGENYASLLRDLHEALAPKKRSIAITMAAWQPLPKTAFEAVNWVQIMAYDHEGRHATMESAKDDVKTLIDRGAPAEKIVLGLPFYGRGISRRNETATYAQIVSRSHPEPDVDEFDGLYFNGPKTIRRKTRFARESHLAGVMVWEIGQDAPGEDSLLKVIVEEASNK